MPKTKKEIFQVFEDVLLLKDILIKDKKLYTDLEFEELVESLYDATIPLHKIKRLYKEKQEEYQLGASLTQVPFKDRIELFKRGLKDIVSTKNSTIKETIPLFNGEVCFAYKSHEDMLNNYPEKVYNFDDITKNTRQWLLSNKLRELFRSKVHIAHSYKAREEWTEKLVIGESTNNKYQAVKMRKYVEPRRLALHVDGVWYYNE